MYTPKFDIYDIQSTIDNAKAVIDLNYNDLLHAGLSNEQAEELADSENRSHIERQMEHLNQHSHRHLGAIALGNGSDWVGYTNVIKEWPAENLMPFCNPIESIVLKAIMKYSGNRLIGRPFGIQRMVVVDDTENRKEIIDELLRRAIELAGPHEIYTTQYYDMTTLCSLMENSFELVSDRAVLQDGCSKKLYKRPFPAPKPDYCDRESLSKLWNGA